MDYLPHTYTTPQKLGRKTFWIFLLQKSIAALILLVVMFVFFILSAVGSGVFFSGAGESTNEAIQAFFILGLLASTFLFIVFAGIGFTWTWYEYKNYTFMLGEHALEVKRGIFYIEHLSIPYHHIEDINIEQSLFYQLLGVCRVAILTAGHGEEQDESAGILPVIELGMGQEIRKIIVERSNVQEVINVDSKTNQSSSAADSWERY